jgi:hypothetical protein
MPLLLVILHLLETPTGWVAEKAVGKEAAGVELVQTPPLKVPVEIGDETDQQLQMRISNQQTCPLQALWRVTPQARGSTGLENPQPGKLLAQVLVQKELVLSACLVPSMLALKNRFCLSRYSSRAQSHNLG